MPSKVPRRPLHQRLKRIQPKRLRAKVEARTRTERTNSTAANANEISRNQPHITAAEAEEEEEEVEKMETISDIRKAIWVETPTCE